MNWNSILQQFLCRIYRAWGGDCGELGETPAQWVATVVAKHQSSGAPTFSNPADRKAFLETLDGLEAHLALPENSLSTVDTQALLTMITTLRQQLGA